MSKYMIHSCVSRLWYVREYLIPSMLEQGIDASDILLHIDEQQEGCLKSTLNVFENIADREGGIWHLQDDIIICSDFKERTEKFVKYDVVCGFCSEYDVSKQVGNVTVKSLWYSFPCIYILNNLAGEFVKWVDVEAKNRELYKLFVEANKYDDTLFNEFLKCKHVDLIGYNVSPNLVNHIDYLIGGSVLTADRSEKIVSLYWDEPELIIKLRQNLEKKDVDKH